MDMDMDMGVCCWYGLQVGIALSLSLSMFHVASDLWLDERVVKQTMSRYNLPNYKHFIGPILLNLSILLVFSVV